MADATIHTRARIIECRGDVFLAELKNGKSLIAHRSKPLTIAAAHAAVGDHVIMELTPYDFDSGRIVAIEAAGTPQGRPAAIDGATTRT
jgi:translation initiation factor IF-1